MAQTEVALRSTALKAFRALGIEISVVDDVFVDITPSGDGLEPRRMTLPEELSNKTVRALSRYYKIPIHWFWNPIMNRRSMPNWNKTWHRGG